MSLRLLGGLHHRHHDPQRPHVQRTRDELVLVCRHAHEGHDSQAAAVGHLLLDGVDAGTRVLHVEQDELGAGFLRGLRQARGEELEGEQTVRLFAAL